MSIYLQIYNLISHYVYSDNLTDYAELVCTLLSTVLCVGAVCLPFFVVYFVFKLILRSCDRFL